MHHVSRTMLYDAITHHEQDIVAMLFSARARARTHTHTHTHAHAHRQHTSGSLIMTHQITHTQQTGQSDPTCSKVITAFDLVEQQGTQSTQHFKKDPASSVNVSLGCHIAALPLLWRQVLGVQLGSYPTLCPPAEAMHGQITFETFNLGVSS